MYLFSKWLSAALSEVDLLGASENDFGTHSFRKGIASYCAGMLDGPPVVSIFLRAGWSLGQVQDRYFHYVPGGDQLIARLACGLNYHDGGQFAVLPPHFGQCPLTTEEWSEVLPGYDNLSVNFQGCLPYLLASLVHHWDWLNEKNDEG